MFQPSGRTVDGEPIVKSFYQSYVDDMCLKCGMTYRNHLDACCTMGEYLRMTNTTNGNIDSGYYLLVECTRTANLKRSKLVSEI